MKELFLQFAANPCVEHFLALRESVMANESYDPYGNAMHELRELLDAKQYSEVRARGKELLAGWILSPRLHYFLAQAAQELRDGRTAMTEARVAQSCVNGILATGDGSRANPWIVTTPLDEYDILGHLNNQPVSQFTVKDEVTGRVCDVHNCEDGFEKWFDVTDIHAAMERFVRRADAE
ncbi:DUF4919 domain-containing protein [Candidatus Poribacteria bacterium]|nr:DUF4919 domain-containing protein [Candidatus Poribacteria bacterium]